MTLTDWNSMVTIGRIVRPHGNRGQVVVAPETDFAMQRFQTGEVLHWKRADEVEDVVIAASREHEGRWIVGLQGVTSIDDAERLRGLELRIPQDELRTLPGDRFYVHDLVGCRVETTAGEPVGVVEDVDFGSGTPVLVLRAGAQERLVPFAEEICRRIDLAAKTIVIHPPEGLLDL